MMTLLGEIKAEVDSASVNHQEGLNVDKLLEFEEKYQTLLMAGFKAHPPPPTDEA